MDNTNPSTEEQAKEALLKKAQETTAPQKKSGRKAVQKPIPTVQNTHAQEALESVHADMQNPEALEAEASEEQILWDEAADISVPLEYNYEDMYNIYMISPSGYVRDKTAVARAVHQLQRYGFELTLDKSALDRKTRFAGGDKARAGAFSRAAKSDAHVVMASRGGYGLNRLLDQIDWALIEKNPKIYCGFSDFTAFNLALLAKTGMASFTGPNVLGCFGAHHPNEFTAEIFTEVMRGELEVLSFESGDADAVDTFGTLWGGNLTVMCSLLGTPYFPQVEDGILFLEDVNEHPYRVERYLTQLFHAGVLSKQKAILLGDFNDYQLSEYDNGYCFDQVVYWLRKTVKIPVITGLPYGHTGRMLTLPVGQRVGLATEGEMVYLVIKDMSMGLSAMSCLCGQPHL